MVNDIYNRKVKSMSSDKVNTQRINARKWNKWHLRCCLGLMCVWFSLRQIFTILSLYTPVNEFEERVSIFIKSIQTLVKVCKCWEICHNLKLYICLCCHYTNSLCIRPVSFGGVKIFIIYSTVNFFFAKNLIFYAKFVKITAVIWNMKPM